MKININPNAADERRYIAKPGTYEVTVQSVKHEFKQPTADFYCKVALVTSDGESAFAEVFQRPEKDGSYWRLEQWIAATSTDAELKSLAADGFDVSEDSVKEVCQRAIGRRLKVKVTEREFEYKHGPKAGQKGVALNLTYVRHPAGPEGEPF